MKLKGLIIFMTGIILASVHVASAGQSDDISCCLGDEWVLEEGTTASTSHPSDAFCCIADEWKIR